jgi:heterodisulfide reductase subunit A-like polyferredoxin
VSIKKALMLKQEHPDMDIYILYRDIRTYGLKEDLYTEARKKGILFIRYEPEAPPEITTPEGPDPSSRDLTLQVTVKERILKMDVAISADAVVLASAVLPHENRELFELFKVPVNADGFLNEAHAKLRPVDFSSDGIFLAGLAHYPKSLDETIAQAQAAVARTSVILSRDHIMVGGVVAENIHPEQCARCLVCVRNCPYDVPRIKEGHAWIDPALCHGCGICAAECPAKAIELRWYEDDQIMCKLDAVLEGVL